MKNSSLVDLSNLLSTSYTIYYLLFQKTRGTKIQLFANSINNIKINSSQILRKLFEKIQIYSFVFHISNYSLQITILPLEISSRIGNTSI